MRGVSRAQWGASSRSKSATYCQVVLYYFSAHVAVCGTHGELKSPCQRPFLVNCRAAQRKAFHVKEKIHPAWHEAHVVCACGNKFTTGSTRDKLHVEICSACHPFFTGKQKFVDTEGRVEKFMKRYKKTEATKK